MESLDMELILTDNPAIVSGIVEKTIQTVYPHYYPSGAVQFFLDLHSEVRIGKGMSYEEIYLVMIHGNIIGTGSIRKNEICRLFILPAESMYLKRGYQITSYEKIETENGDFLCYHTMEKTCDIRKS